MKGSRRKILPGAAALAFLAIAFAWWSWQNEVFHYLSGATTEFVALFPAPGAADSTQTRRELDELLELQRSRTPAQVEAARADRKKDVTRFYAALGFDAAQPPKLPALQSLTDDVEDDIGPYARAAKEKFRRLRPYEIEPRLEPCIGDVQGDLSYPSGHATYAFVMAAVLSELVPERQRMLLSRADEYARQRMVCGVHFPSDIDAGRMGARYLVERFDESPAFRRDRAAALIEVRAALKLPKSQARP